MPKLTPSKEGREIYCFIGGAYRPPNHRTWQHIQYFSDLVGDKGEVIVVVSNPKSSKYQAKHSFEDGRTISTEDAVKVLEIFREADNRNNVTIMESEEPSPVRTIYGLVTDPDAVSDCDVLIGCYKDEADFKKWERLQEHIDEKNPSVTLLDFKKFALHRSYENFAHGISSLQRRIGGTRMVNEEDAMPSFLNEQQLKECMEIIYGESWEQGETKKSKERSDSKDDINESEIEADFFDSYDEYDEFVDCYKYDYQGYKVLSSKFDEGYNGLRIFIKEPEEGMITEIFVKNHDLKKPNDWFADCGVNKKRIFEDAEIKEFNAFDFVGNVLNGNIDGDQFKIETEQDGWLDVDVFKDGEPNGKVKVKYEDKRDIDWIEFFVDLI